MQHRRTSNTSHWFRVRWASLVSVNSAYPPLTLFTFWTNSDSCTRLAHTLASPSRLVHSEEGLPLLGTPYFASALVYSTNL